jgi:hypothetical protein
VSRLLTHTLQSLCTWRKNSLSNRCSSTVDIVSRTEAVRFWLGLLPRPGASAALHPTNSPPRRAKSEPNPSLTILSINIYNASNEINKFYFLIPPFYILCIRNAALGCCLLQPWYRSTTNCTYDSELMPVPTGVDLRVALHTTECDCTNDHR